MRQILVGGALLAAALWVAPGGAAAEDAGSACRKAPKAACVLAWAKREVAAVKDKSVRDEVLAEIGKAYARADLIEPALVISDSLSKYSRRSIINAVIARLARTGKADRLLRVGGRYRDDGAKQEALVKAAATLAAAGRIEGAGRVIKHVAKPRRTIHNLYLRRTAFHLARGGKVKEALALVEPITDPSSRFYGVLEVAAGALLAKDVKSAMAIVDRYPPPQRRYDALSHAVSSLDRRSLDAAPFTERLIREGRRQKDAEWRTRYLLSAASDLTSRKRLDEAAALMTEATADTSATREPFAASLVEGAISELAQAFARAKRWPQANKWLARLSNGGIRIVTMNRLARLHFRDGRLAQARAMLAKALRIAQAAPVARPPFRWLSTTNVVSVLAETGEAKSVFAMIAKVPQRGGMTSRYQFIVEAIKGYATGGKNALANRARAAIRGAKNQVKATRHLIEYQAKRGDFAAARATAADLAKRIDASYSDKERREALVISAKSLLRGKDVAGAFPVVDRMKGAQGRAEVLVEIAFGIAGAPRW